MFFANSPARGTSCFLLIQNISGTATPDVSLPAIFQESGWLPLTGIVSTSADIADSVVGVGGR